MIKRKVEYPHLYYLGEEIPLKIDNEVVHTEVVKIQGDIVTFKRIEIESIIYDWRESLREG